MKKKKKTEKSKDLLRYKKMVEEIPDIRQEKVDEIKKKIESGEYKLDIEAIANKMIELPKDIDKMLRLKNDKQ